MNYCTCPTPVDKHGGCTRCGLPIPGTAEGTVIPCPTCGHTDELGIFVAINGLAELDAPGFQVINGNLYYNLNGYTHEFDNHEPLGVACGACGWTHEGEDWQDYLVNYEQREKERIHREFLREAGLGDTEELADEEAPSEWSVPLVSGEIQIVIPITKNGKQIAPIVITADMNTMEDVQNIQIDPVARTVQMVSDEPWVEVTE